jgi:long-chain acyl-CoA synthetase
VTTCPDPGQIGPYLREVRPNVVFGVPRVWEKMHAGVTAALGADPDKAASFAAAVEMAKPIVEAMDWDRATPEQLGTWRGLDEAAFANVREMIGLDQCEAALSGAAPIPPEVLRWYRAIGVPLSEIYGMSENTGPMTWMRTHVKIGTVGTSIPGCEVRLGDDGEVLCRGGNVFGGYLDDPAKTDEALIDGWLHSGDIGELDDDGYLRIVDRKKELIITAGGKNVSPANLEAALKTIPLVGQAMAVGDQRPFVGALVVLDPEVAPVWARSHGIEAESLTDLADDPAVVAEIDAGLDQVMASFNNAERVKKVKVLGEEWLPDTDLLTPTSKLKRRGVLARYHDEIEGLYA